MQIAAKCTLHKKLLLHLIISKCGAPMSILKHRTCYTHVQELLNRAPLDNMSHHSWTALLTRLHLPNASISVHASHLFFSIVKMKKNIQHGILSNFKYINQELSCSPGASAEMIQSKITVIILNAKPMYINWMHQYIFVDIICDTTIKVIFVRVLRQYLHKHSVLKAMGSPENIQCDI